jgi:hypothetical protein
LPLVRTDLSLCTQPKREKSALMVQHRHACVSHRIARQPPPDSARPAQRQRSVGIDPRNGHPRCLILMGRSRRNRGRRPCRWRPKHRSLGNSLAAMQNMHGCSRLPNSRCVALIAMCVSFIRSNEHSNTQMGSDFSKLIAGESQPSRIDR